MGIKEANKSQKACPSPGEPQQAEGWLLPPSPSRASPPRGAPHEVLLLLPHPSPRLLGGPELRLFMLPRIPQPVNSQPRACQGKNNVFQPRRSARAFIPHTALPRQSRGPFLNVPPHLRSRKPRCCGGTACSQGDGCPFWQGNGGSARAISLADPQDERRDPSAPGSAAPLAAKRRVCYQTLQEPVLQ